ncbi:hypothetical protein TDB9533_04143 [Thalassocella blandensis]|nr:hypothetical protein TDB9533_04143 [Thalassocella blandensis]
MIFSIEFRQQTEEQYLRENITIDCLDIASCVDDIEGLVVVFYKQPQREPLVTCHLTLILRGHKSVHIYEHEADGFSAFEAVFQRLMHKLGEKAALMPAINFAQSQKMLVGGTTCQL